MVCPVLSYAQNDASADISSYEKEKISGIRDAYNQNANDNNSKRTFSPGVGRVSFSYFRLFFSLLLICAMIYLIYFFLKKKTNSLANKNAEETSVLLSLPLGMGKNVQVIYIAGKFLIIGVTNDSINYLSEVTDEKEIENLKHLMQEQKIKAGESFANVFQEILKISNVRNDKQKDFDYEESSVDFLQKQTMRINTLNEKKEGLSDKENIESDIKTDN